VIETLNLVGYVFFCLRSGQTLRNLGEKSQEGGGNCKEKSAQGKFPDPQKEKGKGQ